MYVNVLMEAASPPKKTGLIYATFFLTTVPPKSKTKLQKIARCSVVGGLHVCLCEEKVCSHERNRKLRVNFNSALQLI